ncbi:hypothetical protein OJ996_23535 [Luteolibacter sp. GHJ8]|uniref:Uncharacterized protein n=1 Tax=Luteolibacter rhizosphaerae TaxID=2989719 RepID=A0ABT3GBG1_9BACT|nr:hypothetical protein [Luteolibacter rhizosphaerae]MCW1916580.1 hypothetical protein [Luteolibacter rhizosphaerae]
MNLLWLIVLLGALVGVIPFLFALVRTIRGKQWPRLRKLVLIPLLGFGLFLGANAAVRHFSYREYLANLFDTKVALGKPVFAYDSERSFNGDGYSITVYELPDPIRQRFSSADERLLSEFPKRPGYRKHWQSESWRRTPFEARFAREVDMALNDLRGGDLKTRFAEVRETLSKEGAYYAFFYKKPGDYVANVDFYIVDLPGNRLYIINHNT